MTDNGNFILDWFFQGTPDWIETDRKLHSIPGKFVKFHWRVQCVISYFSLNNCMLAIASGLQINPLLYVGSLCYV